MKKIKFKDYGISTFDRSKIIQDFGWYEQEISLAELIKLAADAGLTPEDAYIELSFMDDPYSENPHLLLSRNSS